MQSTTTDFTSNQWVHLMLSIDKSNSNVSFYKNGSLIETHTNTDIAFNDNIKNESMLLGSSFVQTKSNYQGYIDDFTMFDKTLTTTEVNTVYNSYNTIDSLPLNDWSHVVVNYDKVRKESHISINGVEVGKYENYDAVINNNTSNIVFGGDGFVGELGEVNVFERPLSTNEVDHLATDETRHLGDQVIFEATFKDLSSTHLVDSSSNNVNATLTNTPASYIVGHTTNSKALAFNGTQAATLTYSEQFNNFNQMTVNSVMKHDLSSIATLIEKGGVFKLYIDTDGKLKLEIFDAAGVSTTYVSSTTAFVEAGVYANIVVEVDKHESFIKFYKDHVLTDTFSGITINMPQDNTNNIVMGSGLKGGVSYMQIDLGYNVYSTLTTSYAISTNSGTAFQSGTLSPIIALESSHLTYMMRYKFGTHRGSAGTNSMLVDFTQSLNSAGSKFGGIQYNGSSYVLTVHGSDSATFDHTDGEWHTVICRCVHGSPPVGFVNGVRLTGANNQGGPTTFTIDQININDEYNGIDEIDYLVVVPDALTETQMQSVYNDYNEDVEGFLSANNLTPTVKYTFENNNTNTGTAVGLPPVSFQNPDVYTTAGTKFEIPSVANLVSSTDNTGVTSGGLVNIDDYPDEIWIYPLGDSTSTSVDYNMISAIFLYDTAYAIDVTTGTEKAGVTRIQYTPELVQTGTGGSTAPTWDALLSEMQFGVSNEDGNRDLFIKLKNITGNVRSVYVLFYRPKYAFDYKLQFRKNNSKTGEFSDTTQSIKTDNGDKSTYSKMIVSDAYGMINIDLAVPMWVNVDYSTTLLANYTFDESGGITAIDKSTNANHGTLVNDPVRSFGTYDVQSKGLKLDASSNQSVTVPGTPYTSVDLNTMTLSAWVKAAMIGLSLDNFISSTPSTLTKINDNTFGIQSSWTSDTTIMYDTGIQIDLVNDAGKEIWFDFKNPNQDSIASRTNWLLNPLIMDSSTSVVNFVNDNTVFKYGAQLGVSASDETKNYITKNTSITRYNGYTGTNYVNYDLATQYVVLEILNTDGNFAGYKEVRYKIYNNPARLDSHLVVTIDLSYFESSWNASSPSSNVLNLVFATRLFQTYAPNFTLSNFMSKNMSVNSQSIVSKGSTEFDFAINADGKMEFIAGAVTCTSASVIPSNSWNHLAVTLDEYKGEVKFYKNGENTDTFTPNPFVSIPMTTTDLTIGSNFTGELDNVMIHQGVVDLATETQLYTIPDSMYTPQTITSESWTHVAAVYNKEQNMVSMYQDGQHTGSFENYMTDFTDVGVNDNKMYIGTTGDTTTFYDGILDDVRVYKSALTTEDIGEIYAIYDQTVISYIDKTSVSTEFMYLDGVPDVDVGSVTIGDGVGTDTIQYYAFAMDNNRLSGKQDMQFFIDQIDTIPTTFYKTNNIATASTAWNVGTLTKVISSDLITEADVSSKSSVYVYVLAQNTVTSAIDYYKQQIMRSYLPAAISMETYLDQTTNSIKVSGGAVTSVVRYCILTFVDQPALSDVQTFVTDNIYSQISADGGNYLNVGTSNVPVYVYKAPNGVPASHDLPTSVSLNKAFTSTSDVDGYAIPTYPDVYQFTTYIVAFDAVGNVIENADGWVLINRDIASATIGNNIVNIGSDTDAYDSTKSYSRLGDLMNNEGEMTEAKTKLNGKYTFRMIPYGPLKAHDSPATEHSEYNIHFEDPEEARWYLEWTQVPNPTTLEAGSSEISNMDMRTLDGNPGYTQVGFTATSGRGVFDDSGTEAFYGLRQTTNSTIWLHGGSADAGAAFTVGNNSRSMLWFLAGSGNYNNAPGPDMLPTDPNSSYRAVGRSVELWIKMKKTYTPTYTPVQTERAQTVSISEINTGINNTSTIVTSGDSTEITVTSTDTDSSATDAIDTGIQIDLQNDAGVEYWFDFNHLSATGYYYLVPTIMDPADISGDNEWGTSGTTAKYASGQLMMNNTYTTIYNNTTRTGYNGNEALNTDTGVTTSSGLLDTHYAVIKVLETDGKYPGFKEVQYQAYNGPERLSSQLIATMDMSYYTTTFTSGAPSNASIVIGIYHKTNQPQLTLSNFKKTVQSSRNVASVGAPKNLLFDNTAENAHTLSFGLESVTASDTANTDVYAMVSTRDLYYDTYANDLSGYLKEIANIQDSLTPILTVSAGATVAGSAISAILPSDPPTDGLILRIDPDAYTSGDIVDTISGNAVSPAYAPQDYTLNGHTIKAWNYSTTGGAASGANFATAQHSVSVSSAGFTFARWVHWESITGRRAWRVLFREDGGYWYMTGYDDDDFVSVSDGNNLGHTFSGSTINNAIDDTKWQFVVGTGTQTGWKTLYVIDVDESLSDSSSLLYDTITSSGTAKTSINFRHMVGVRKHTDNSLTYPPGWIGDTYMYNKQLTQAEVYNLWNTTRNKYYDQGSPSNPFTLTQAVDNTGVLVDLHTVSTGHLYTWAHTLGGSVNARSVVQRVDEATTTSGWVLVNRDVANDLKSGEIRNIGSSADSGIFESSYSILGDLKEGTGDMADEYAKSDGKYRFRLIPYKSADAALEPDNTTRYLEWTQTNNPTTTTTISGFADFDHAGGTYNSAYSDNFIGMRQHTGQHWLHSDGDWYYTVGQTKWYLDALIFGPSLGSSATDSEYGERVDKIELYIWLDLEVPGVYQQTGPTNKAIQTNLAYFSNTSSVTVSENNDFSFMMRFKIDHINQASIVDEYIQLYFDGLYFLKVAIYRGGSHSGKLTYMNLPFDEQRSIDKPDTDTWVTVFASVSKTESTYKILLNGNQFAFSPYSSSQTNTTLTMININEQSESGTNTPHLKEMDYLVVVPDALSEAQMQSLYTNYSEGKDIESFLSANSLSPTVNYQFNGDNTNTGSTAAALPAITFQATDTYSDYTTQTLVQASKNVLVSPPEYEWILLNRDIVGDYMPSTIQNVSTDADAADSTKKYSRLGDLQVGHGDMADSIVKADGKYKFRLVPYNSGDAHLAPDNTDRYIEWTQTSNPTTTIDATGFADYTYAGDVHLDTGAVFDGLKKVNTSDAESFWMMGAPVGHVWYEVGAKWEHQGGIPFAHTTTYATPTKVELWVLAEKKATTPFEELFGEGWTMIKHLPGGSTSWFPGNDNLLGYEGTEFLFTTGDYSRWLICDQTEVNGGTYSGTARTIKRSSISESSYTAIWYNRGSSKPEDPYISLEDHTVSLQNKTMMYGENSREAGSLIDSSGMYVYIR